MMSSLGIPLVQGLRMLVNGPSGQLVQIPEPDEDCVMEPWTSWRGKSQSPYRSFLPGWTP